MIPLIKNKTVSEYDSAYSSKLWLFENVEKEEYLSHLEDIKSKGYKEVYKTDIEDNLTTVFENGEALVFSSYYPCDKTVRTVLENNKNLPEYKMRENIERKLTTLCVCVCVCVHNTGGSHSFMHLFVRYVEMF